MSKQHTAYGPHMFESLTVVETVKVNSDGIVLTQGDLDDRREEGGEEEKKGGDQ